MSISPFVYWAQTEEQISLKVDLKDVKVRAKIKVFRKCNKIDELLQSFNLKADKTKVNFNAVGVGAQGLKEYKFTLDLLEEIDSEKIKSIKTGHKVDIFLPKIVLGFWSRLVSRIYLVVKSMV